ncbi:MAG: DUF4368 domain-containing protein, partial [Acutalibacter sp.]|nr:DUF4368 domain-containing protein [Acutalibacter sp.]
TLCGSPYHQRGKDNRPHAAGGFCGFAAGLSLFHELIDRITIYETPGMGRCRKGKEKRITIYYKFVRAIQ